jgi:hypothetical protein
MKVSGLRPKADAFVRAYAPLRPVCFAVVGQAHRGRRRAEVATEHLDSPDMIPPVVPAPVVPGMVKQRAIDLAGWFDDAPLSEESADRAAKVFHVTLRLAGGRWRDEIAAFGQTLPAINGPIQDAGHFLGDPAGEAAIFFAVKRLGKHERDEATGHGAADVGEAWQFVGEDQEAGFEVAVPRGHTFTRDGLTQLPQLASSPV